MTARVLTGSKQEIAQELAGIDGDVREAIVFVEEPAAAAGVAAAVGEDGAAVDLFAEMEPYTVQVNDFDDSRQTIYSRLEHE